MGRRTRRAISLPAPYLRRVWLESESTEDRARYPLNLPLFRNGFELTFEKPITVLVGENGVGKSTLIEGIAALAGYDDAGGGKGYRPIDHSRAQERSGGQLAKVMKAAWRPKITTGWFFRAESFFSVARYLDEAANDAGARAPDFLSHSHGEGFLRFFSERCTRQGIYFFDEPESALSPRRQIEFLKILRRMQRSSVCQVVMATHSPLLMGCPDAELMLMTRGEILPLRFEDSEHFRTMKAFFDDPSGFLADALKDDSPVEASSEEQQEWSD